MMSMCNLEGSLLSLTTLRFGNFIGEAEESEDEESQQGGNVHRAYDLDDEEEEEGPANDQQLVELDGNGLLSVDA